MAATAFAQNLPFVGRNTEVRVGEDVVDGGTATILYLHGHGIIWRNNITGVVSFTMAGYPTRITIDRINCVLMALRDPRRVFKNKVTVCFGFPTEHHVVGPFGVVDLHGPLASLAIAAARQLAREKRAAAAFARTQARVAS